MCCQFSYNIANSTNYFNQHLPYINRTVALVIKYIKRRFYFLLQFILNSSFEIFLFRRHDLTHATPVFSQHSNGITTQFIIFICRSINRLFSAINLNAQLILRIKFCWLSVWNVLSSPLLRICEAPGINSTVYTCGIV